MTTACIAYYLAARDYNYCKEIRAFKKQNNYGIPQRRSLNTFMS